MHPEGDDQDAVPWQTWDETLYAGSADHYARGRVAYPEELVSALRRSVPLDPTQHLVDVGCGPGSLGLLLAPHVRLVTGVDADADMLVVAARTAARRGISNTRWHHLRAEQLPADVAPADVITFAQSFHWMDRLRVATAARRLLVPGAALVHVHATTHRGLDPGQDLDPDGVDVAAGPAPPWPEVDAVVRRHLGPGRRAGSGVVPRGTAGGEDEVYRAAGFSGPQRVEVAGRVVERTVEEVVSSVLSLSSSTPRLLGGALPAFVAELREVLLRASDDGRFTERMRGIAVDVWR